MIIGHFLLYDSLLLIHLYMKKFPLDFFKILNKSLDHGFFILPNGSLTHIRINKRQEMKTDDFFLFYECWT
ncbi:MAG TPA: hypothetical protein DSN98_09410 [Thermoplasmata archaeon]|nr:MAG TPA: hypothetical protein DSN98_09410 [Thermoplasmata archaeon]